jgi:hypothetical protein
MLRNSRGLTADPGQSNVVGPKLMTVVRPQDHATDPVCARTFSPADAEAWDRLVQRSINGTFLHSRRFLSYHGDRFRDRSVIFTIGGGPIVGVLPAALDPADDQSVVSHPGATYGGIVHDGTLQGNRMAHAMEATVELLRLQGGRKLRYRAVPYIYHRCPALEDVYWLRLLGATRYDLGLSTTVDVERRMAVTTKRRQKLRKAYRAGVIVGECHNHRLFWRVVEDNLMDRHGVRPVHSFQEMELLRQRFPDQIKCFVGRADGEVIAGSLLFMTDTVVHAQYNANTARGRQLCGLDLVIERCIELTARMGRRYYDFGISTEEHGNVLNEGLRQYKASFGAGATTYESYELVLGDVGESS